MYHYEKKITKNIRPTDILLVFSKCSQIYQKGVKHYVLTNWYQMTSI